MSGMLRNWRIFSEKQGFLRGLTGKPRKYEILEIQSQRVPFLAGMRGDPLEYAEHGS
jgi:hypothetical protein